jgi:predicted nucleotide-binding protein
MEVKTIAEAGNDLRCFVGYSSEAAAVGQSVSARLAELRPSNIEPVTWEFSDNFPLSASIAQSLVGTISACDAAVLIFTADDEARIRGASQSVARDNVVFELGLAVGALGLERSILMRAEDVSHVLTDWEGITVVPLRRNNKGYNIAPAVIRVKEHLTQLGPRPKQETADLADVGIKSVSPNARLGIGHRESLSAVVVFDSSA